MRLTLKADRQMNLWKLELEFEFEILTAWQWYVYLLHVQQ